MSGTISVFKNYERLSSRVAQLFARHLLNTPETTLGFSTGETPKGFYRKLIELYQEDLLDFERVTAFNLDEFYPVEPDHPARFSRYMHEHLYDHVNINSKNTFLPDGTTDQPERKAEEYEELIQEHGGIDLQLLGIGENGHVGFNEPGSSWSSQTRVVSLDDETQEKYADGPADVPDRAITMGIKTIMNADRIVLMASGIHKTEVVSRALEGPVTREVPASVLQLHPNLHVVLDRDAAANLEQM